MLALAFKAGPSWRQRQRSALWWMSCSHASVLDHRIRPDASRLACGCNVTIGVVFGTLLGERILRKIPERTFRRVVAVILLGVGGWAFC